MLIALGGLAAEAKHTGVYATSFFYIGVAGAVAISLIGPFYWNEVQPSDW